MKLSRDSIAWWEMRRILFNVVIFFTGVLTIILIEKIANRWERPYDDVLDLAPIGILLWVILYGFAANAFYTLGWITETLWSQGDTSITEKMRPKIFWLGTIFSIALTLLPAGFVFLLWGMRGFP